jgi:hypothetical protein
MSNAIKLQDVHFTGTSCYACIACTQGQVILSNYIHFWSSAKYALNTQQTGGITAAQWFTLFTMHNNYFSEAFCYADMISIIRISYGYASFAGAATGVRYQSINNSVILTGGGPTYLPGNIGGVTYNNGLYV